MKIYRMSSSIFFVSLIGGAFVGLLYGALRQHPLIVFLISEVIFFSFAGLSWISNQVYFDKDNIVQKRFFVFKNIYSVSDVTKIGVDPDVGGVAAVMPTVAIEFNNGKRIILVNFKKADIEEIIHCIKARVSHFDDSDVFTQLTRDEEKRKDWRTAFRTGDKFLFTSGAVIISIFILWWLMQKFLIA